LLLLLLLLLLLRSKYIHGIPHLKMNNCVLSVEDGSSHTVMHKPGAVRPPYFYEIYGHGDEREDAARKTGQRLNFTDCGRNESLCVT